MSEILLFQQGHIRESATDRGEVFKTKIENKPKYTRGVFTEETPLK
jgi:hypothetical protein